MLECGVSYKGNGCKNLKVWAYKISQCVEELPPPHAPHDGRRISFSKCHLASRSMHVLTHANTHRQVNK